MPSHKNGSSVLYWQLSSSRLDRFSKTLFSWTFIWDQRDKNDCSGCRESV